MQNRNGQVSLVTEVDTAQKIQTFFSETCASVRNQHPEGIYDETTFWKNIGPRFLFEWPFYYFFPKKIYVVSLVKTMLTADQTKDRIEVLPAVLEAGLKWFDSMTEVYQSGDKVITDTTKIPVCRFDDGTIDWLGLSGLKYGDGVFTTRAAAEKYRAALVARVQETFPLIAEQLKEPVSV